MGNNFELGLGIAQTALSTAGQVMNGLTAYNKKVDEAAKQYEDAQEQIASQNSNATDFRQLANDFNNLNWSNFNPSTSDLLGGAGENAFNIISGGANSALQGMSSTGSPWGALAGIPSLAANIGGYFLGKENAKLQKESIKENNERINETLTNRFNYRAAAINQNNLNNTLLSLKKEGGMLNDRYFTNGIRFIEEGGSHESNPLSGVPQGIAADGIPNLVEEGEVIYNDYVYSRRLKVPQADKESLGLKKDKEYTYADAAKQIQKESEERPNDPISRRNLEEMMSRLQGSQEALKEKRDGQAFKRAINKMTPDELSMFIQQLQQPQQMQPMRGMQEMQPMQPTQSEVPMFGKGGLLGHIHASPLTDENGAYLYPLYSNNGYGISTATTPLTFNNTQNIRYEHVDPNDPNKPVGKLADTTNAYTEGLFGDLNRDWAQAGINAGINVNNNVAPLQVPEMTYSGVTEGIARDAGERDAQNINNNAPMSETDSGKGKEGFSVAQALRAAPVFGSIMSSIASMFDSPNYSNIARAERAMNSVPRVAAGTIGQRLTYNPVDINYIANAMNNQAIGSRRALVEGSLGNAAAASGQLAALNYTSQTALGNALMQAARENDAKKAQVATFNRETDSTNISNALQASLANQQRDMAAADFLMKTGQLRDAELGRVQANRSANLINMFNNIGNLGQDMLNRDMAKGMAQSYGVTYNPYMDAAGNTAFGRSWVSNPNKQSKGGKLNTKKGGKNA